MKHFVFVFTVSVGIMSGVMLVPAASAADDTAAIRAELNALKAQYEARIAALEQRLSSAEQQLAQAPQQTQSPPPALAQTQEPAPVAPSEIATVSSPAPAGGRSATPGSEFNPAIGVILNGAYRAYQNDPDDHAIPGVPPGGDSGLDEEGFSVGESEFVFTANVDDWFYSRVTTAVEQDGDSFDTSLEEAFIDTLTMPASTALRFGRFFSAVGYLNDQHSHTWDFADQALPYRVFLDTQYGDDGLQFSWLAPTDLYWSLGSEVFRGTSYPAAGAANNGAGTYTLFTHIGGDVGISHSWSAGLSWMKMDARERDDGSADEPLQFDGDTDIAIADLVWKWAPNGNITDRNLVFQTEYLWRNQNGDYLRLDAVDPRAIDADSSGWYAQLIYQWRPRWRAGVRIDGLDLDDPGYQFTGTALEDMGDDPLRYSLMFDYSNSEFSRIRLQLERDETGAENNNQFTLQYIMSIGAHGAHEF